VERGRRIELLALAWKAKVLPLYEPREILADSELINLVPRETFRTLDLPLTRRLLCQLSYMGSLYGVCGWGRTIGHRLIKTVLYH
jgi:hypothetical protein